MMLITRFRSRWGRNLLTILAIAISFAMLLSLTSIALGLDRESDARLRESPRDIVISSTGLTPSIENSHIRSEQIASDPNVSASMPLLTILGTLSFDVDTAQGAPSPDPDGMNDGSSISTETMGVVGLIPDQAKGFMNDEMELFIRSDVLKFNGWFQESGDPFFLSNYTDGWTGEMIIDRTVMEESDLSIGDPVHYIGDDGNITASFLIVGTLETSLAGGGLTANIIGGIAVVHLSELQFASDNHYRETPEGPLIDLSTAIYVDLEKELLTSDQQRQVTNEMARDFQGLDVTNKESRLYRIEEEVLILEVFSISVAVSSLSIGVLFLSSIMIIDVEERRPGIAIMRSIGISRRTIFLQIMRDSLLLASLGSLLGIIPGYFGSMGIDAYLKDLYGLRVGFAQFDIALVIGSLAYVFVLVIVFSLAPAFRATTMVPKAGMAFHYNR